MNDAQRAAVAAIIGTCAELHAIGAIRTEHAERFGGLRVALDQLAESAGEQEHREPVDVAVEALALSVRTQAADIERMATAVVDMQATLAALAEPVKG